MRSSTRRRRQRSWLCQCRGPPRPQASPKRSHFSGDIAVVSVAARLIQDGAGGVLHRVELVEPVSSCFQQGGAIQSKEENGLADADPILAREHGRRQKTTRLRLETEPMVKSGVIVGIGEIRIGAQQIAIKADAILIPRV